MTELIKQAQSELMNELKKHKMLKPTKDSAFQKTEKLLCNYNQFKKVIEKKQQEIDIIKAIGLSDRSKSIVILSHNKTLDQRTPGEKAEDRIEEIQASMVHLQGYIQAIEDALETISNNEYFELIELLYFEGKTREEVAEYFEVDVATISRHKKKMIDIIKIQLFPDDSIMELFY
jgi:DNA-directed RNA polymerase specialized sigma subunit